MDPDLMAWKAGELEERDKDVIRLVLANEHLPVEEIMKELDMSREELSRRIDRLVTLEILSTKPPGEDWKE